MARLIAMEKNGEILQVHPTCVADHITVGWKALGEVQMIDASSKKESTPVEKGGPKDKLPEGNVTPPVTDESTTPPPDSKENQGR